MRRIYTVTGETWQTIENHLNQALDQALAHAVPEGLHGIMVTRRTSTSFTVEISPDASYGMTMERWE
ncbi:hypothetical protein [Pseudarthrobacter albicanus]|uniref:hypothetical protein n=1 Tax=Pseudarthrobacter albicanus TaxID=2823873 RepID=UPI001BA8306F|nr:hypothetical protein [Pseudarthrobacter albicanus]